MTDDQKPYDDDLTFDDAPVVPEDPRSLDEGDDFLDEVDEPSREDDFLKAEEPGPDEEPGFAVHHGGAELFGGHSQAADEAADDGAEAVDLDFLDEASEASSMPVPAETRPSFMSDVDEDAAAQRADATWPAPELGEEPARDAIFETAHDGVADADVTDDVSDDGFDDVFVIEFDGADSCGDMPAEPDADEEVGLTPMAALRPEMGDVEEPVVADAATEFREDRAGWLGEDLPLAEFLGERVSTEDESVDLFEEGSAADEDPFAIDEVELEVEDAEDESDPLDFVLQGGVDAASDEDDDAWAPLGSGESWVMGSDLGGEALGQSDDEEIEEAESVEEDVAPVFGMGRFDPTLSRDEADDTDHEFFGQHEADLDDVEADHVDPIYGDVGAGIDEVEAQPYGDADGDEVGLAEDAEYGDEFDETYIEKEPSHGRVIGALRGAGRSPWTKVAAALLVTIGAAGGTVATMRPEWFGLLPGAVAPERVEVARPQIQVGPITDVPEVETPTVVDVPSAVDAPAAPVTVESPGSVDPVAVVSPKTEPTAVPSAPLVETAPLVRAPESSPVREVSESPSPVSPRVAKSFVGFETRDGMEIHDLTDAVPPRVAGVQVVSPGERAFAQLRNAEIFVGVVKRVEASFVTLDLEPGEISLSRSSLTTLTPLASNAATEMLAAQHGYVRLPTEARLWGQILRNPMGEDVILQTEDAQIRVPRGSVVQLQGADPARTALVDSEDDSWLDSRIREQLRTGDGASGRSRRR